MEDYQKYINPGVQKVYDEIIKTGKYHRKSTYWAWVEWKELDILCAKRKAMSPDPRYPSLSYIIMREDVMGIPIEFQIWYRCKSIVCVKDTIPREPIFGYLHKMHIVLPNNYPSADGNPIFTFRTDVWHPNIRHSGTFKGHVCLNTKENGILLSLKECILHVERYLKYQAYHIYPNPEDKDVAKWIIEEGEPFGLVKFDQVIPNPTPISKKALDKKQIKCIKNRII